jgi:hypothetical protein
MQVGNQLAPVTLHLVILVRPAHCNTSTATLPTFLPANGFALATTAPYFPNQIG